MSISEYLNKLDYDQLCTAKELVEGMLNAKREEERVPLWVVCDDMLNRAAFREEQYTEAVNRLCDEIKEEAQQAPGIPIKLELIKRRFRESEVNEMLSLT